MKRLKRLENRYLNYPATDWQDQCSVDAAVIDPDVLRDRVLKGFSILGAEEAGLLRDNLLSGLNKTGLNVGASLLLIGCLADSSDEVTPPGLAQLVRYVRINRPGALAAVRDPLARLITIACDDQAHVTQSRRAA